MKADALEAAGMIDASANWTGKYGIHSAAQFLDSPEAQEKALTGLLNETERQLRANGSFDYIGTIIQGRIAPFVVTRAGLIAAAHREDSRNTLNYLERAESYHFETQEHDLRREDRAVETRLRTFADAVYQ